MKAILDPPGQILRNRGQNNQSTQHVTWFLGENKALYFFNRRHIYRHWKYHIYNVNIQSKSFYAGQEQENVTWNQEKEISREIKL